MKTHRNWGIAALVFTLITCISAFCKPLKKSHPFWGGLAVFCMTGAVVSGLKPKKKVRAEK